MKRIMIVDDEPDQILTVEYSLKYTSNDYEIIAANSGEECLDILKKEKDLPDIILLDIMMPDMNGFEVFENIRSDPRLSFIPVIFLTGSDNKIGKDVSGFLADDYIMKPFETEDLIKRINKILDKK